MKTLKNLALPIIILTLAVSIGIYFRPLMVIDETRYIGVAWEMWDKGNFLVPHLNGTPYDHKFPLLFWLIHLDWWLLGVNETSVRLIPLLFAIGSVVLTYKIYLELFKDEFGAKIVGYIVAGTVLLQFYASLLMFDVMLSFFALLGIYGFIIIDKNKQYGFLLVMVAVCLGILAKGPVVVAHLLPTYLFFYYWSNYKNYKNFYIKATIAGVIGILLSLFWILPAVIEGGDAYAKGLLLKQSIGRMANAFDHKRPLLWYLQFIPIFMIPWILYSGFYNSFKSNFKKLFSEIGLKFIAVWFIGTLIIFSLISGKQVHYIMPEAFALSILIARFISINNTKIGTKLLGLLFLLLSIIFISLIFIIKDDLTQYLNYTFIIISSVSLFIIGIVFFIVKFNSNLKVIQLISLSSIAVMFAFHFSISKYLKVQNLTKFSNEIAKLQNKGYTIIHDRKYADQYHFLGKLHEPIKVIWGDENIYRFTKNNNKVAVITYKKRKEKFDNNLTIATTKFRTSNAILLYGENWIKFIK